MIDKVDNIKAVDNNNQIESQKKTVNTKPAKNVCWEPINLNKNDSIKESNSYSKAYEDAFEDPDSKPTYVMWGSVALSAIVLFGILGYILFIN